jgi:hypothetical protein
LPDLTAAARKTGDRLQTIEGRISALQSIMPLVDAKMKANFDASQLGVQRMPSHDMITMTAMQAKIGDWAHTSTSSSFSKTQ